MEVRKRDGVLIGHASPAPGGGAVIVRQRVAPPFMSVQDPRSLDQILAETPVVETFVFETRGAVILVDEQDPYLIPGFIPFGKAVSLTLDIHVHDGEKAPEDVLEGIAAHQLAEEIVKGNIMRHTTKRNKTLQTAHRFSVYVTRGEE